MKLYNIDISGTVQGKYKRVDEAEYTVCAKTEHGAKLKARKQLEKDNGFKYDNCKYYASLAYTRGELVV